MTRHGRNATNSAVYTYHERKKDAKASGFGTEHRRLGKDSIKGFDCCSLTLRPCRHPVVTPQGWLFDKEAVLKYVLEKREDYQKRLAAWEKQRDRQFQEMQQQAKKDEEAQRKEFEKKEKSISRNDVIARPSSSKSAPSSSSAVSTSTSKGASSSAPPLPSFWVPSLTPDSKETKLERPQKGVVCPMSGKALKIKDLVAVKFTLLDEDEDAAAGPSKKNLVTECFKVVRTDLLILFVFSCYKRSPRRSATAAL